MMLILEIFFSVAILSLVESREKLVPPTSARAEIFPYHAVIETEGWWCNGVIISKNFVLTRASCTIEDKKAMIYVGFTRNPYISRNLMDSAGQIFHAEEVFVHEEFGKIDLTKQFINNLALIKLHRPLVRSATVQPIALASPDDFPIPTGSYINVTGFLDYESDGNIQYATVQMRDLASCELFYGDSFLNNQERCVRYKGNVRPTWAGPYVVNGVLVGIQRSLHAGATCLISTPPCDVHDVFLSLENYLEWIYRVSDVAGENAQQFSYDNPFWQYRPEKIQRQAIKTIQDIVIDLQVNVETCRSNENEFILALQQALKDNLNQGLKSVTYTVTV